MRVLDPAYRRWRPTCSSTLMPPKCYHYMSILLVGLQLLRPPSCSRNTWPHAVNRLRSLCDVVDGAWVVSDSSILLQFCFGIFICCFCIARFANLRNQSLFCHLASPHRMKRGPPKCNNSNNMELQKPTRKPSSHNNWPNNCLHSNNWSNNSLPNNKCSNNSLPNNNKCNSS